ncbi:WAT1-related protein At4g30420-like isoform X3 [Tripterygium wilfordii]|uniref:WAT1-related protein At4g30420-like isoform X3 n=1 Tax=Tripterygium wilfordii TaxID=458696 RepID=UPI0018F82688|nr:WAT1-related protein At4g30420-like isoform X3 [Tripterygium wilfordii]
MGGLLGDYKYALAMFGLQFASAGLTLLSRAAFVRGTSPRVFIVYRQAIATLFVAPIAYFTRRKSSGSSIGLRSFALIFLLSLIGVTINQNIFFEGLFLSSSSMASAMTNLVPAITFVMASIAGLEKVNIRSSRSIAKIVGTVICVGGAVSMAMLKGPKLLNSELPQANSAFGSGGKNWLLGCLCLFGSTCCWSLWLILQVPLSISYPDPVSLSAWMCFLATIQSAVLPFFLEKNADAWILHSKLELISVFFAVFFTQNLDIIHMSTFLDHQLFLTCSGDTYLVYNNVDPISIGGRSLLMKGKPRILIQNHCFCYYFCAIRFNVCSHVMQY